MKKSVLKIALSLGVFAAPFALSAKTVEQAYVESYKGRTDIPVPVSVVKPEVSHRFAGATVEVEFLVDTTGNPVDINVLSSAPAELVTPLTSAVAQWKFSPALSAGGEPVAMKVRVPFRIVDEFAKGTVVAMK